MGGDLRDCGYVVVSYMYNAGVLLHTQTTPPEKKMQEDREAWLAWLKTYRWGSSTSQSNMIDNFTTHIAFYAVWRSQHTHLQSHCMHNLLLPHINILCGQGSHIAQWCFGPTLLCSFFSSIRSRLLQEVKGLETEEIERVSYLVPCMHVLINIHIFTWWACFSPMWR